MKRFCIWFSEYGNVCTRFVKAADIDSALQKAWDYCRRLSAFPGAMRICRIMEVDNYEE